MKKTIASIIAALLTASAAIAATAIEAIREACPTLTPTNSLAVTNNSRQVGRVLGLRATAAGGSVTVRVYSVTGAGLTYGTSHTVVAPTVCTPSGLDITFPTNTWLVDDKLITQFDNAAITSSVTAATALIVERP